MKKVLWIKPIILAAVLLLLATYCNKEDMVTFNQSDLKSDSLSIVFNPDLNYGTVADIEGHIYKTIRIGTQVWMAENLKTTKYLNGDTVPFYLSAKQWCNMTTGACKLGSDLYGNVYNAYAVEDSRKLCPAGWHVPTSKEWDVLLNYLGGENKAGSLLKEVGTTHWLEPNVGATNQSGFTALPGGNYNPRTGSVSIQSFGTNAVWWSSSRELKWFWTVQCANGAADAPRTEWDMCDGLSVRCMKGDPDPLTLVIHAPTAIPPGKLITATTNQATNISPYYATLNGTINSNGLPTIVTFEYGTTINYGNTDTAYQSPVTDNYVTVSRQIRDVIPLTTYHYRVKAENSVGKFYGNDVTVTIYGLQMPQIEYYNNGFVTNLSPTGATLNSKVNANGLPTIVTFEYGSTASYGSTVRANQNPITGNIITEVSGDVSGLISGTFNHFRVKAENSNGITYGNDCYFTTGTCNSCPSATTLAATNIDSTGSVTLKGVVNANGLPTTVTFLIPVPRGEGKNYNITVLQIPVTGNDSFNVIKEININNYGGIQSGTRYYRIKAENSCGTAFGAWTSISFLKSNS